MPDQKHDTTNADPHAGVHEQATQEQEKPHHDPVPVADDGDYATKQDLADVNKALTKRINDLRTDFGTFTRNVSASVQKFQDNLKTLETGLANLRDSVEAQDAEIDLAKDKAGKAAEKATQVEKGLTALDQTVRAFRAEYATHTHDVAITLQGETQPPKRDQAGDQ